VLIFLASLSAVVVAAVGPHQAENAWNDIPGQAKAVAGVVFLGGSLVVAEVLTALRPAVLRLYQGYWSALPGGGFLMRSGRERTGAAVDPERPWTSPTPDRLMATRLGNILRAAEQQADRYGMDAVTAWPRLYAVLPEPFTILVGQAASSLDLMITISALGVAFALVASPIAALALPWYWAPLLLWLGGVLSWTGYQGALGAAARYGDLVRAAFDVHRWQLLDAMGLARPTSWAAELSQWQQIHQLWQRGRPDSGAAHLLGYTSSPVPTHGSPIPPPDDKQGPPPRPSSDDRASPGRPTGDAPSLGRRPLLIALGIGAIVFVGAALSAGPGGEKVRASHDLPDFHVVADADLTRPEPDLVGRYTLVPISRNSEISPDDLGPRLPAPGLSGRVVTTLAVARPAFVLSNGEVLTVLPLKHPGPAVQVTVLAFSATQESLTVAMSAADLASLLPTPTAQFQVAR